MVNRLILTKLQEKPLSFYYDNDALIRIEPIDESGNSELLGNIYTARVKNILPNINAAFVDIGGEMCFYSLESNKHTIWLNKNQSKQLKCNDEILVQIEKEPAKTKNASVTCYLTFQGKYCVLTYQKLGIGISKKIHDAQSREELKNLYQNILLSYDDLQQFGLIVRTDAVNQDKETLTKDAVQVLNQARHVLTIASSRSCGQCLYQANDFWSQCIDSVSNQTDTEIITDIEEYYEILKAKQLERNFNGAIIYHQKEIPLSAIYDLKSALHNALAKEVWLPCGGYLVMEPCEALTVIDVNTGKSIHGKHAKEEHLLKVNLEAARAVAQHLQIRNYSGIIIIDFIDMKKPEHNAILMQEMKQLLAKDSVKTTIVDITGLGLMELTRKKIKKPLHEHLKAGNLCNI